MPKIELAERLVEARARADADTPAELRGLPKFARLTRKEARIREDQVTALDVLARALMRRRSAKAERITENTLIRVAIDLLLARAPQLRGSTEDELRHSVTTALQDSRTSALTNCAGPALPTPGSSKATHSLTSQVPPPQTPEVFHGTGAGAGQGVEGDD